MALKIRSGIGAVASVMSKLFHPRKPIHNKYPNRPKNHKLEDFFLVEEDVKVVQQGSDAIPVLSSPMPIFQTNNSMPSSDTSM